MVSLALVQPECPSNVGTLLRVSACWGVHTHIIGPLTFVWGERRIKRAGMDYMERALWKMHTSWEAFTRAENAESRKIFLVPSAVLRYTEFKFEPTDILCVGSESTGFDKQIQDQADHHLCIPMRQGERSLNMAMAAGIVLAEALRQTHLFPENETHSKND